MSNSESYIKDTMIAWDIERENSGKNGKTLFDRLGGRSAIERVHKIFYDKIYAHVWIGKFFVNVTQQHIEAQQSDFMQHLFGGPKNYSGRMPIDAHVHMMINEEMFRQRQELLEASLIEAGVAQKEREDWVRIDGAFKKVILKKSVAECKGRYVTDPILDFPDPKAFPKAG